MGTVFPHNTELELAVAELIHDMVPSAELVRFANSGTEAVMTALRLARGFTGKDGYVLFEGSYHGLFDAAMWQSDVENTPSGRDPAVVPLGKGIPASGRELLHLVPFNDADRLESVLRRDGHRIAAVLIELILANCCGIPANAEYARAVRELCNRYDVLLIVDEVKTGFRVARGGAQQLFGVRGDLCTLAKAMANG